MGIPIPRVRTGIKNTTMKATFVFILLAITVATMVMAKINPCKDLKDVQPKKGMKVKYNEEKCDKMADFLIGKCCEEDLGDKVNRKQKEKCEKELTKLKRQCVRKGYEPPCCKIYTTVTPPTFGSSASTLF